MRSEGYSIPSLSVGLFVCLFVLHATRRPKRYEQIQNYAGLKTEMAIFPKLLRSSDVP